MAALVVYIYDHAGSTAISNWSSTQAWTASDTNDGYQDPPACVAEPAAPLPVRLRRARWRAFVLEHSPAREVERPGPALPRRPRSKLLAWRHRGLPKDP